MHSPRSIAVDTRMQTAPRRTGSALGWTARPYTGSAFESKSPVSRSVGGNPTRRQTRDNPWNRRENERSLSISLWSLKRNDTVCPMPDYFQGTEKCGSACCLQLDRQVYGQNKDTNLNTVRRLGTTALGAQCVATAAAQLGDHASRLKNFDFSPGPAPFYAHLRAKRMHSRCDCDGVGPLRPWPWTGPETSVSVHVQGFRRCAAAVSYRLARGSLILLECGRIAHARARSPATRPPASKRTSHETSHAHAFAVVSQVVR
jgi:hypothetical protein